MSKSELVQKTIDRLNEIDTTVQIGNEKIEGIESRQFSTGGFGKYGKGKVTINGIEFSYSILLSVIGSKEYAKEAGILPEVKEKAQKNKALFA